MGAEQLDNLFQDRIDANEKIEPRDYMPEEYRSHLIRQMSQHAHSEVIGMQPEGNWITRAPSLRAKKILLAKVQDEAGHGLYIYSAVETLGITRDEMIDKLHQGKAKYASIFNYPALTWSDIGAIGWLVDGAAITNQVSLQKTSYGPYARSMVKICKEESFHQRQGFEIIAAMANGTIEQKEMAQDSLNRFWWPSLMMFGPHDSDSPRSGNAIKWKIKKESNDVLRKRFIDKTVMQAQLIGLTIPDPDLKWNAEENSYDFGAIDWEEFWSVVKGGGLCSLKRLNHHKRAHKNGEWVRKSALAYSNKHQNK
ncbi:MAG: 1,2-phenylacetyl-CoA epoxidase subunit A [Flavobacteriales bacterium]|nr:1,2-phenylacetyl-CoA epoxidase subunit A [Flavobacteriales bacterium]